jgi:hypothetical protein
MTVEEEIEALLFGRVRSLTAFSAEAKSWPNVKFDPPAGAHLEVEHLPNENQRIFLDGADPHFRQGILQLTVVAPLNRGPSPVAALAGAVAAHFPADLPLFGETVKIKVQSAPSRAQAIPSATGLRLPISIRYETFA